VSASDFREPWQCEPAVAALAARVSVTSDPAFGFASASMTVRLRDGRTLAHTIDTALGHPGNPLGWEGMREKFVALATPVLGSDALPLFDTVRGFGDGAEWPDLVAIIRKNRG
jgi:2-methylcitrate dehydratase PrpD